jgi:hypothetical protein
MTASNDVDRFLASWLESAGPADMRPEAVMAGLDAARRVRQRSSLSALLAGPAAWPRYGRLAIDGLPAPVRVAIVLALLAGMLASAITAGGLILKFLDPHPAPVFAPTLTQAGALGSTYEYPIDAVALGDGRVVVAGFGSGDGRLAEVFDPATGESTPLRTGLARIATESLSSLPDGRLLVIAWQYAEPASDGRSLAWILDPTDLSLTPANALGKDRFEHSAATLPDGRVVISGGLPDQESPVGLASVEIFDPSTGQFSLAGELIAPRQEHHMTLLGDGRLLVSAGGPLFGDGNQDPLLNPLSMLEIYDPSTRTSARVAQVPGRVGTQAKPVVLADGSVFLPGVRTMRCGRHGVDPIPAYRFDAGSGVVTQLPPLPHDISLAYGLPDGRILIAGYWGGTPNGCSDPEGVAAITDAWIGIYDPVSGVTLESRNPMTGVETLALDTDARYDAAALLPDGRLALVSAEDFGMELPTAVDLLDLRQQP